MGFLTHLLRCTCLFSQNIMYCFTGIVFVLGFNALAAKIRLLMQVKWDDDNKLLQMVINIFITYDISKRLFIAENF